MSIYIKGIEMPTERDAFNLTIKYNGTVLDTETGMQVAEAYNLPPHGRLIDADALLATENQHYALLEDDWYVTVRKVESMPTIIEVEEE